jgi:hypothetical protein
MADDEDGTIFAMESPARHFSTHLVKSEYVPTGGLGGNPSRVYVLLLIGAARTICSCR